MPTLLNQADIQKLSSELSDWQVIDKKLFCLKKFTNFIEAIAFVNKLVEPAEAANHHPDIEISYNQVKIYLTTHDAGGLTQQDFILAKEISHL
ncbi:MAG: 4a-hydroxytetrahydrobiopterin dehydratase [Microcoleaceae cyanobacterium]